MSDLDDTVNKLKMEIVRRERINKMVAIGIVFFLLLSVIVSIYFIDKSINDSGGFSGIIVMIGKWIKDIFIEIDKHKP